MSTSMSLARVVLALLVLSVAGGSRWSRAQEAVFSGPQPGEKVTPFKIRGISRDGAGKEIDLVSQAKGGPLLLVFIHEVSRPSIGLTRLIMDFAVKRADAGLTCGVVMLNDDATEAENFVKRASQALPANVPIGVSPDGREGPGAYGLNRKVALTVLVVKDNVVRGNFALIQPSIQADAERIVKQVVEVTGGGTVPTLADLGVKPDGRPAADMAWRTELEGLMRALIRLSNDENAVKTAANSIEKLIEANPQAKARLAEITTTIVSAGKLESYGTPAAQQVISRWAKTLGTPSVNGVNGKNERKP